MSAQGVFVTGTDTEIGKTYVARLLVDTFAARMPTTYMKPVQTGCDQTPEGALVPPDVAYCLPGVDVNQFPDHAPYRFAPACSPHLAAAMADRRIDIGVIIDAYHRLSRACEMIVVEGAGGVRVPLNQRETMLDIMCALHLPVVVVTSPKLGTLNHTLMTVETLRRHGLTPVGIAFNNAADREKDFIYKDNLATISRLAAPCSVIEIDYNSHETLEEFCDEIIKRGSR